MQHTTTHATQKIWKIDWNIFQSNHNYFFHVMNTSRTAGRLSQTPSYLPFFSWFALFARARSLARVNSLSDSVSLKFDTHTLCMTLSLSLSFSLSLFFSFSRSVSLWCTQSFLLVLSPVLSKIICFTRSRLHTYAQRHLHTNHAHTRTHTCTHTHTHIRTHTNTHTQTHTNTHPQRSVS